VADHLALSTFLLIPMKPAYILLSCLLLTQCLYAQFAIIRDKDGYTNVRNAPRTNAGITFKLKEHQVFTIIDDLAPDPALGEWHYIGLGDYTANGSTDMGDHDEQTGYIHKSRVLYLDQLPELKVKKETDAVVILGNDTLEITIHAQPFVPGKHIIQKHKDGWIQKIDHRTAYGMDGGMPLTEISRIMVRYGNEEYRLPADSFQNMYQPNLSRARVVTGHDNDVYIVMMNSDGAGSYEVVWVIKNRKLLSTVVFMVPY